MSKKNVKLFCTYDDKISIGDHTTIDLEPKRYSKEVRFVIENDLLIMRHGFYHKITADFPNESDKKQSLADTFATEAIGYVSRLPLSVRPEGAFFIVDQDGNTRCKIKFLGRTKDGIKIIITGTDVEKIYLNEQHITPETLATGSSAYDGTQISNGSDLQIDEPKAIF